MKCYNDCNQHRQRTNRSDVMRQGDRKVKKDIEKNYQHSFNWPALQMAFGVCAFILDGRS